jgi:hypothetical protein
LSFVNSKNSLDALEFDDNQIIDEQVDLVTGVESDAVIEYRE